MSTQVSLTGWQLDIDTDMVLRGQGADPIVVRQRRPRVVEIAEQALVEGMQLIQPSAVYRILPIQSLRHETMTLEGGAKLTGALVAEQMAQAQRVALIVCTLENALENRISMLMQSDPAVAFALDGFGTAAMESLGAAVCAKLDAEIRDSGSYVSVPLSPGMIGWQVDVGQRQIFSVLDAGCIGVTLNDSFQMIPRKSTSMILGLSSSPFNAGRTCDFCGLRETCRYQNREMHFGSHLAVI